MMFFRKKSIKKRENERLVYMVQQAKEELDCYEELMNQSIEPTLEAIAELKKKRAKYIFLLKEARHRQINGYKEQKETDFLS